MRIYPGTFIGKIKYRDRQGSSCEIKIDHNEFCKIQIQHLVNSEIKSTLIIPVNGDVADIRFEANTIPGVIRIIGQD